MKNIFAHTWTSFSYDLGKEYIKKRDTNHQSDYNNMISNISKRNIKTFENRMNYYILDPNNEIVYKDYKVVDPKKIENILYELIQSDPNTLTSSWQKLHQKIIHVYKYLGISEKIVYNFFQKYGHSIKSISSLSRRPIIKSFRPTKPREHWQIDFIVIKRKDLLKANGWGNRTFGYILVIVDIFSKYCYIKKCIDNSGLTVASTLESIFLTGDIPEIIQSDNEKAFAVDNTVLDLYERFNIQPRVSNSYSPQTNGFVENKNKQIKSLIYLYIISISHNKSFINSLPNIEFSLNTNIHRVTKLTPIQVHFGIMTTYKVKGILNDINIEKLKIPDDNFEKATNETPKNDNEFNSKEEEIYAKSMKESTKLQINNVRKKINNTADKYEARVQKIVKSLKPGIFVKIHSFYKQGINIGGIVIKINDIILQHPLFKGTIDEIIKPKKIGTKLENKLYDIPLKIISKTQGINGLPYYNLITKDKQKVERYTLSGIWSDKFYGNELTAIDILDENISSKITEITLKNNNNDENNTEEITLRSLAKYMGNNRNVIGKKIIMNIPFKTRLYSRVGIIKSQDKSKNYIIKFEDNTTLFNPLYFNTYIFESKDFKAYYWQFEKIPITDLSILPKNKLSSIFSQNDQKREIVYIHNDKPYYGKIYQNNIFKPYGETLSFEIKMNKYGELDINEGWVFLNEKYLITKYNA